jgi:hypothetical protein
MTLDELRERISEDRITQNEVIEAAVGTDSCRR